MSIEGFQILYYGVLRFLFRGASCLAGAPKAVLAQPQHQLCTATAGISAEHHVERWAIALGWKRRARPVILSSNG